MASDPLKQQLMEEMEATIDELLKKRPLGTEITVKDIESLVGEAKSQIGNRLSQALAETVVVDAAEKERVCEKCGGSLRSKGHHAKTIQSERGKLTFQREYLYCPACEQGVFPPR